MATVVTGLTPLAGVTTSVMPLAGALVPAPATALVPAQAPKPPPPFAWTSSADSPKWALYMHKLNNPTEFHDFSNGPPAQSERAFFNKLYRHLVEHDETWRINPLSKIGQAVAVDGNAEFKHPVAEAMMQPVRRPLARPPPSLPS